MTDFWAMVKRTDGCWEWQGSRGRRGYGNRGTHVRGERRAHREAYRLTYGDIPAGLIVMHVCDNPPCVRPDHLRVGTQRDNLRDAVAKGRLHPPKLHGSQNAKAKLTEEKVIAIRARHLAGESRADLAAEFGVTKQNVWLVTTGIGWAHIGGTE